MITKLTDLQKVAFDVYKGNVQNYSIADGNKAIQNAITEACSGEWNYYRFMDNKYKVFAVISEVLSVAPQTIIQEQFMDFADVHNVALGDSLQFEIEDADLFRVATIADGSTAVRRQKLYDGKLTVSTSLLAVKIYAELNMFMAGRVDFAKMIDRVNKSIANQIGTMVYNAIYNSYSSLSSTYGVTGSFADATLQTMVGHVEAKTGKNVAIYGTKTALAKITGLTSATALEDIYSMGYFGQYKGTPCIQLPQAHTSNTDTFAVNDSFLLIVPNDEKIVKIVFEGDAIVNDVDPFTNQLLQKEFFFGTKVGVSAITARGYGIYKLS